jgi:hypothetical protein
MACQESPSARCTLTVENVTSTAFASLKGLSVRFTVKVPVAEVPGFVPPPAPPPLDPPPDPPPDDAWLVELSGAMGPLPPPHATKPAVTSAHAVTISRRVDAFMSPFPPRRVPASIQQPSYRRNGAA